MIHRLFLLCIAMTLGISVWAQKSQTEQINQIKKDTNYLYVTGTSMKSEEESYNNAQIMLAAEIEEWLKKEVKGDAKEYIAKAKQNAGIIKTKIGPLFRTFTYIKKTEILSGSINGINNKLKADTTSQKKIIDKILRKKTPAKTPETVAQTDTTKKVVSPTPISITTDAVVTEKKQPETVNTNPNNTNPSENKIKEKEVPAENKEGSQPERILPVQVQPKVSNTSAAVSRDEEINIAGLLSANAVKKYLSRQNQAKRLDRYGEITDYPKQGTIYMLLSDYHGIVRQYIRVTDGKAINLKNGSSVDITNISKEYSTKYSIWFTFK